MGNEWDSSDLVRELLRDRIFFTTSGGGVTFSGGEPTYQADFMIETAEGLKKEGIHVALDTCGYCSESVLRKSLAVVDMVLYDLKVMDPERHLRYTGVPVDRVLSSAKILGQSRMAVWVRTPIIPGHTDDDENIRRIARFIKKHMPNVERWDLLAFNKMCVDKYRLFGLEYPLRDMELVPREKLEELASIASKEGVVGVHWSGMTRREMQKYGPAESVEEVGTCGKTC
jgi:pyruvate formate lyase activating enzyme